MLQGARGGGAAQSLRIHRVMHTRVPEAAVEGLAGDAGLHQAVEVLLVDLHDARHPREVQADAPLRQRIRPWLKMCADFRGMTAFHWHQCGLTAFLCYVGL
jgi:hypothetical protein